MSSPSLRARPQLRGEAHGLRHHPDGRAAWPRRPERPSGLHARLASSHVTRRWEPERKSAPLPRMRAYIWKMRVGAPTSLPSGTTASPRRPRRSRAEAWEAAVAAYASFVAAHGHRPGNDDVWEGRRIGRWVVRQRWLRKSGDLSEERVAQLDSLGFAWDRHAARREGFLSAYLSEPDRISRRLCLVDSRFRFLRRAARRHQCPAVVQQRCADMSPTAEFCRSCEAIMATSPQPEHPPRRAFLSRRVRLCRGLPVAGAR